MKPQMENGRNEIDMKRENASAEAGRDTFFGDMDVNENSPDGEVTTFLEKYQNAVIAGMQSQINRFQKQSMLNESEIPKLSGAIADWEGKEGGEKIIDGLRQKIIALGEKNVELVGGSSENSSGKVGELEKQLDNAIHIKEALLANPSLFANKYRNKLTEMKSPKPGSTLTPLEG